MCRILWDKKNSAEMSPDQFLAASGLVFSSPCEKSEQILCAEIRYIRTTFKKNNKQLSFQSLLKILKKTRSDLFRQ